MTLRPAFLNQLWRRKLLTRSRAEGLGGGNRPSKKNGEGMDFADFRPYAEGDTTRHIDPNLYARLGKLFVRQYVEERPLQITIVLDCSASMMVPDSAKFIYAKSLVEALGALALAGGDRLRLYNGNGSSKAFSGKAKFAALTQWLAQQTSPQEMNWSRLAQQSSASALNIVVSDFLFDTPDAVIKPFTAKGGELWAIQLLTSTEESLGGLAPGALSVTDAETGAELALAITPHLIEQYKNLVSDHRARLAKSILSRGGTFHALRTDQDFERVVLGLTTGA